MIDKLTKHLEVWLSDSADDCETSEEDYREEMVERMFRWMLRILVPQLAVAFGLLLAIIFFSPIEKCPPRGGFGLRSRFVSSPAIS